jgi:hypothetical protein
LKKDFQYIKSISLIIKSGGEDFHFYLSLLLKEWIESSKKSFFKKDLIDVPDILCNLYPNNINNILLKPKIKFLL